MALHRCPERDKSFKDRAELFNHIENYHRQMAMMANSKCPYCEGEDLMQLGTMKSGDVSFQTGELQGDEFKIFLCQKCNHLSKNS